jgi:hypothetical protein
MTRARNRDGTFRKVVNRAPELRKEHATAIYRARFARLLGYRDAAALELARAASIREHLAFWLWSLNR